MNNPVPVLVTKVRPHEDMEPGSIPVTLYADNLGEQGPQGIPGVPGPPNILKIGTVTEGPADATITGTSPAQVLNLTLPAGGGGGLRQLDQGEVGGLESIRLVVNDGEADPWFTGTFSGYVESTPFGAPGIVRAVSDDWPDLMQVKATVSEITNPPPTRHVFNNQLVLVQDGAALGLPHGKYFVALLPNLNVGDFARTSILG